MRWTEWSHVYTTADERAFGNAALIDAHFGLPYPHLFSLALNENGGTNIHEGAKQGRAHYLANLLTYRFIKSHWEDAWIWDERYRFAGEPKQADMVRAQREFLQRFGEDAAASIAARARKANLDPGGKTSGRPDLAVHFPADPVPWRFIELKLPDKGDAVKERQARWLDLFAEALGPESAVVLEWKMEL